MVTPHVNENVSVLEETIKYFNGDKNVANIFSEKYSFNKSETPRQVYLREANELAKIEYRYEKNITKEIWDKLTPYGKHRYRYIGDNDNTDRKEMWSKIFDLLYGQEICSGGSVTSTVGTGELSSISNCTVIESPHDSLIGLNRSAMEMQLLAKRRCGVGMDISTIRPEGAIVNNQSKISAGVVLWMNKYSNAINEVAQSNRRGALLLSIHCMHPDVLSFILAKKDLTKVTGANISVKWTDEFWAALDNNGDWITTFPVEIPITDQIIEAVKDVDYNVLTSIGNEIYVKKLKARDLWNTFIKCSWQSGEPGGFLWSKIIDFSPNSVYKTLRAITTNPCGEIDLAANDSCRLIHKNLTKCVEYPYVRDRQKLNENKLYRLAYENVCLGDNIVDLEVDAIDRILNSIDPFYMKTHLWDDSDLENDIKSYKLHCIHSDKEINDEFILWLKFRDKGLQGRRCGCGLLGWGDMYAMLGVPYGDEETTKKVMRIVFKAELDAQYDLAIIRGPFPLWDRNLEFGFTDGQLVGKNDFYQWMLEEFPKETERMFMNGRRNSSWSTVAPTGTKGLIAQVTSGIEPIFQPYYIRRKKVYSDQAHDFVDKDGQKFTSYVIVHHGLEQWLKDGNFSYHKLTENCKEEDWKEIYKSSPYYLQSSHDLNTETRVKTQGMIQQYITESISSTVNLKKTATIKDVEDCYIMARKYGLKGITVYRDGCRAGILVTKNDSCEEFIERSAPKRPKVLPADLYKVKYKGKTWIVTVGLYCDRPYELFVFEPDLETVELYVPSYGKINDHKGIITKVSKGCYEFKSDLIRIPDMEKYNSVEEKAHVYRTSLELRHGTPLKYLINVIKRYDDNVTSFSSLTGKILSKYIKEPENLDEKCPQCGETQLIREIGCVSCTCGWSKC